MNKLKCQWCNTTAQSNYQLKQHIKKVHEAKETLKCPFCPQTTNYLQNLNRHINSIHQGRKFHCFICDRPFTQESNLKNHIKKIHLNEKPHKCEICHNTFRDVRVKAKHIKTLHPTTPSNQCDICQEIFVSTTDLKQHKVRQHKIRRLEKQINNCNNNKKLFNRRDDFDQDNYFSNNIIKHLLETYKKLQKNTNENNIFQQKRQRLNNYILGIWKINHQIKLLQVLISKQTLKPIVPVWITNVLPENTQTHFKCK